MPRPPNYSQERKDRDRAKAAKKAEKLAARAAKAEARQSSDAQSDTDVRDDGAADRD